MIETRGLTVLASARLREVRRVKNLLPVLYDKEYCSKADLELPVYEIFRDSCDEEARNLLAKHGLRYDVTIMPPLMLGQEYVKTVGHYHAPFGDAGSHPEIFEVLEGEAHFLIQKQGGETINISLLAAREGEKVLVAPDCGHVIINTSSRRLVTGNLISQNCIQTYDQYLQKGGAAVYVLAGQRYVKNPHYSSVVEGGVPRMNLPFPGDCDLVQAFQQNLEQFAFLNEPKKCPQWNVTA